MEIRSDIVVFQIQKCRVTGESICHSNRHTMEQLNSLQIPWASVLARPNVGVSHCYCLHPKMFLYSVAFSFNYDSLRNALRLSSQGRCSTTASPFSQHVHVSCCLLYNNHKSSFWTTFSQQLLTHAWAPCYNHRVPTHHDQVLFYNLITWELLQVFSAFAQFKGEECSVQRSKI